MSNVPHFASYAAAFEKAFESDDWSVVEPFFREDAVYEAGIHPPLGGVFEGREAILAYFKWALDNLDRKFESRAIELLEGPRETGDAVWIRGTATYQAAGVPELVLELEETVTFDDGRIVRLEDRYQPEMADALVAYLREHGDAIGFELELS